MADSNNSAQGRDGSDTSLTKDDERGDSAGEMADASRAYWSRQDKALSRLKTRHGAWSQKRRAGEVGKAQQGWKRVTFSLPRAEAQEKAREFLKKYPKAAYWSEVESWRELPGDIIEFTMRRLPTAD